MFGGACSLWQEASDRGFAMRKQLIQYLSVSQLLWHEGCREMLSDEYNRIIALLYPVERDRINNAGRAAGTGASFKPIFEPIDISGFYNTSLTSIKDYSFILSTEKLPGTIPFDLCRNAANNGMDAALVLAGHGMAERVERIPVNSRFDAIGFLHSYTADLTKSSAHPCTYIGWEKDIVGYYIVEYMDGHAGAEFLWNFFQAYRLYRPRTWSSLGKPGVYDVTVLKKEIKEGLMSKNVVYHKERFAVYSYEWVNPYPEKPIRSLSIEP